MTFANIDPDKIQDFIDELTKIMNAGVTGATGCVGSIGPPGPTHHGGGLPGVTGAVAQHGPNCPNNPLYCNGCQSSPTGHHSCPGMPGSPPIVNCANCGYGIFTACGAPFFLPFPISPPVWGCSQGLPGTTGVVGPTDVGLSCKKCKEYFPHAEGIVNQFICYACKTYG